jgi:colanic acid/amylovoran biosynthesis glycosyltransferase
LNLVIFTASYPFSTASEQTFIGRELPYLVRNFDRIIFVPQVRKMATPVIPMTAEVDEGFVEFLDRNTPWGIIKKAFLSLSFYSEIRTRPSILLSLSALKHLIRFTGQAELTRIWTEEWIQKKKLDVSKTIFYSYWFNEIAMGLGLAKRHLPQMYVVARAHGYDIYEERYSPPYWPCRRQALSVVDKLFLSSDDGKLYLSKGYPEFSHLYETARLGAVDPGFTTRSSDDNVFRIVSCSAIIPLKRVDLLLMGISRAAQLCPDKRFEWHHFGEGKSRHSLQRKVEENFPTNAKGYLEGYLPNSDLNIYYKENPTDVFVNLSESEGIPMSIMEAISSGIPVIATGVGGNCEIVSDQNGILLSSKPTPDEIAEALLMIAENPILNANMKKGSRRVWQTLYNAEENFLAFANRLKSIRMEN